METKDFNYKERLQELSEGMPSSSRVALYELLNDVLTDTAENIAVIPHPEAVFSRKALIQYIRSDLDGKSLRGHIRAF
jgi:hypothetical protein